jgi:hypothetical protein
MFLPYATGGLPGESPGDASSGHWGHAKEVGGHRHGHRGECCASPLLIRSLGMRHTVTGCASLAPIDNAGGQSTGGLLLGRVRCESLSVIYSKCGHLTEVGPYPGVNATLIYTKPGRLASKEVAKSPLVCARCYYVGDA